MEKITPSEYLKSARQDFENLSADTCNEFLRRAHKSDGGVQHLFIAGNISRKYYERMQSVWTIMAFNILFKNATDKYTLTQRHKMMQDAYRVLINQAER